MNPRSKVNVADRFNQLTVIAERGKDHNNQRLWECLCACGKYTTVAAHRLTSGKTKTCGCLSNPDLTGRKFGSLTVLSREKKSASCGSRWKCLCSCGKLTVAIIGNLKSGATKSCGCGRSIRRDKVLTQAGYVLVDKPDHPRAGKWHGRVLEHILVMEEILGRFVTRTEEVHHIKGVRDDNRPENLELWSKSHPAGQRVVDKIAWATELLRQYAPERLTLKHKN